MPYYSTKHNDEIYYECLGTGEPLVFIHGLGATSEMYKPQVEYFKNEFKVICIDLRGNGKSAELECSVEKVLNTQINDIMQILNHLDIEQATFIGVSYGGVLIQKIAIDYPNIVKKLIISDSFCDTSIDSFTKMLAMLGANQTWILKLPSKWLARLTKSSYKHWELAGNEMQKVILNMRRNETILQRKAINNIKFNNQLKELNVPALCLVGNHTKLGVKMMKQVSDLIKGEFKIIENSFDPSNLCQPLVFNEIVREFLLGNL